MAKLTPAGRFWQKETTNAKDNRSGDLAPKWDPPLCISMCKLTAVSDPIGAYNTK